MPATTFCNEEAIVHTQTGGYGTASVDVCQTQVGTSTVPIPYTNVAEFKDVDPSTCPKTVTFDGGVPLVAGSKIVQSTGDEMGCAGGGTTSGTTKAESEFLLFSFDVFIEGKPLCRHGDPMWHNQQNTIGV